MENGTSEYAEEGRRAHKIAANFFLTRGLIPGDMCHLPQDDQDAIHMYLDYCVDLAAGAIHTQVETEVALTTWIPEGFGTADFIAVSADTLTVVDLKFGKGVKVYAEGNYQLMIYALGAFNEVELAYDIKMVKLVIVQPRIDHIDEAELLIEDLLGFGEHVKTAATAASQLNAPLNPGPDQCRWCLAKAICRARAKANLKTAMEDFGELPPQDKLTLDEIGALLPKLGEIQTWAKALEEYAFQEALKGQSVPGHKLVRGRSTAKWAPNAMAKVLALPEADELIKREPVLVGITVARKVLGKTNPLMDELLVKPKGKPALVPETDRRVAVSPEELKATALEDFDTTELIEGE
jgi:hypothetical protein